MTILLVDVDASIAVTFRIAVISDSSCARCCTRNTCFASVEFGGVVYWLTKSLKISENFSVVMQVFPYAVF